MDTSSVLPRLADLRLIDFPMVSDGSEWLVAFEDARVEMPIRRVFSVHVDKAAHRGEHAHRLCNQVLICLAGRVEVICDDGAQRSHVLLDTPGRGLLVPAGIWASQDYADSSTLMVLCDQPYDPADYLRVYQDFLAYRSNGEV
jgi:hypothetical protein